MSICTLGDLRNLGISQYRTIEQKGSIHILTSHYLVVTLQAANV